MKLGTIVLAVVLACWAGLARAEGPELPQGLQKLHATLTGSVVKADEKGLEFTLKVAKVTPAEGMNARDPQSAVGMELLINPQWEKGTDGQWHPVEAHVKFIKALKAGDETAVTVVNDDGGRLHMVSVGK